MPKLHVIDPLLVNQGGHYLSQHVALSNLCKSKDFDMISYAHINFDDKQMPMGVEVKKIFGKSPPVSLRGHYSIDLAASNIECFEDLRSIDHSAFAENDIIFLTSITASRAVAYGKWLREVIDEIPSRIGLYAITSSEIDDTLARQIRRNGVEISEDSFLELDDVVVPNELKRSMFRYLFDSIPYDLVDRFRMFYDEPFPNRAFLELSKCDGLQFIYTHSMYSGIPKTRTGKENNIKIAYLGSGGVEDTNKGQHLIADLVGEMNHRREDISFVVQLGSASQIGHISGQQKTQLTRLKEHNNLALHSGLLDCETYCELIEQSDIVLLPYGPRYRHTMSGIFDECLYLGKVAIIPEHCKMSLWMDRHNLTCPVFKTWDVKGVSNAIDEAINNIDYYRSQFAEGQKIYLSRWEKYNPIDAFN